MNDFPDAIVKMVVTMHTLLWFGLDKARLAVDFGPTPDDGRLNGVVAIFGEDALLIGGVNCGRIGDYVDRDSDREKCNALWVSACDVWTSLPTEERDQKWHNDVARELVIEISQALVQIGAITQEEADARLSVPM